MDKSRITIEEREDSSLVKYLKILSIYIIDISYNQISYTMLYFYFILILKFPFS